MLTMIFFYFFTVLGIFYFISAVWETLFYTEETLNGNNFRDCRRNNLL